MDSYSLSEGLFLKNYLGTVSAVPRSRTVAYFGTPSTHAYGKDTYFLENGMFNHGRISYELNISNNETELEKQQNDEIMHKNANTNVELIKVVQVDNNEEKEKKKERKWTLGGFFRKKGKKDADDSSNNSDEDKKGFLSRRKFKRDRRKLNSRTNANGFDVVVLQQKNSAKNGEISMEQLWSNVSKGMEPNAEPVRFINRHPDSCKTNNALQLSKYCNRNSNNSRINGGSENTEGKKNRKEVMARAEAKRDMLRDDSSSEEYDSYQSNSSLNRHNFDCRRIRRTDRYKRLSKDEDIQSDLRMIKSDYEGDNRLPPNCRWISNAYCADSSDFEAAKLNSETSSCRSPRTRRKLHHHVKVQKSFPTSTFPPSVHCQQVRTEPLDFSLINFDKENQPLISYQNTSCRDNWNSDSNLPKSVNNFGKRNRKTLMDYEQFKNSCESEKEKSLSYDQIIYRASCFKNEPKLDKMNQQVNLKKTVRNDEVNTRNGKKFDIYNQNPQIFENPHNEIVENRNDSALSQQSGIFPQQPTQILERSPSGNPLCENSSNFHFNRSNSFNHIPFNSGYCSEENIPQPKPPRYNTYCSLSPTVEFMPQKSVLQETSSVIRYYADQNPRSRNPIHITCNSNFCEQPYLSDSQMVMKSAQLVRNSASDFWKFKDKEFMKELKKPENLLKLPPTQNNLRLDTFKPNSPKLKGVTKPVSKSSGNAINENEKKTVESNINKTTKEEGNASKVNNLPPEPPVRKLSKEEVLARLQKCEKVQNQENELRRGLKSETKTSSNNLDEALLELEMIYNSLRLKDDDLVDRADRRDIPGGGVLHPKNSIISVSVRDELQNFFSETVKPENFESTIPVGNQRDLPLRRSGVPDKMTDDMAFRRMNQKDRAEVKKLPPQSYLPSSPALSPFQNISPIFRKESLILEPDVMYDDVMFRNIRHANSTLKIQDPQPPFGIPIGLITPAPDSDYLHATPKERFRPTFISSKTPDVVKDDLAFRNLRKDSKASTCLGSNKIEVKKRAVRSLSANLYTVMQKDSPSVISLQKNGSFAFKKNREKTLSLTDLTKAKYVLEKRLKELKEEKSAKRAEFFELKQEESEKVATDLVDVNGNFKVDPSIKFKKSSFPLDDGSKFRSPIVELSKFPAAAPLISLQGDPINEVSSVDDDQLENLLSALAKEAENASKDLKRQLDQLETKKASAKSTYDTSEVLKVRAIEEFNKKFKALDSTKKRRRNLSLSSTNEAKEEILKTGSLERKKKNDKSEFALAEVLRKKINETTPVSRITEINELAKFDPAGRCKTERKQQSQSFEVVSDLSEILQDVEVESQVNRQATLKETNVFQEVYEYNCKLSPPKGRVSQNDEDVGTIGEVSQIPRLISDVEMEFEKLHQEVNSTKKTKEIEFALVKDLIADITSVSQPPSDSYSSFPFPNGNEEPSNNRALNRKDETCPKSSEGEGEAKKASLVNNVWLSCSYVIACAFYLQEIDFLTALGIALAVISIVAILIL